MRWHGIPGRADDDPGGRATTASRAAADVVATSHAVPMVNVLRPDVVRPSLPREDILAGAPLVEDFKFRVPQILGEEG